MKVTAALIFLFVFCNATYSQFTYTRDIKDSNYTVYPYNTIVTNADNYIIATISPSYTSSRGIYVTKLNNRGNLEWSKNYSFSKAFLNDAQKIYNADNDNFYFASRTDGIAFGGDLIFKGDSNGNILWAKRIRPSIGGQLMSPYGIVSANDKSIYVINYDFTSGLLIQKLDSVGEPLWNKYLRTDSAKVLTLFAYAAASLDNGLIISTTSSKNLQNNYNHIFKISKDGVAETEYTTSQASDDYIYAYVGKAGNDGKLNILFSQYGYYLYSTLNLTTGQAETYRIGSSIFDIQSFFRRNKVNVFKGATFPYVGFEDFISQGAFTKNWSLIQTIEYRFSGTRNTRPRIQRYDSLGRICPNYQILDTLRVNEKIAFKFTKSPFYFSPAPFELNIVDTIVSVQNIDTITKICAGLPPAIQQSYGTDQSIKTNTSVIKIFPNPASAYVNVFINSKTAYTSSIEISDVHGKILKTQLQQISKGENNIEININDFAQGVYFLKFSTPGKTINQKIIKL